MLATRVGRNDPCPCGSGRKYKKCHLGSQEQDRGMAATAAGLHRLDHLISEDLLDFAKRRFGIDWLKSAEKAWGGMPEDVQLFGPWILYHYRGLAGTTAAAEYLASGGRIEPRERAWLEAQSRTWLSVWEITDVRPGAGLAVRDLLTGEERTLHERKGSHTLVARDVVLGRVIDHDGVSVFCGIHHRPLGPRDAEDVVSAVRRLARSGRRTTFRTEELRSQEMTLLLVTAWEKFVAAVDAAPPPKLQNTDGDPLLLTEDRFQLAAADRQRVIERLTSIEGSQVEENGADLHVTFTRAGNRMHKGWENTIVGHADVRADAIVVFTNSTKRADAVRKSIEHTCGALVRHQVRQLRDPQVELRAKRSAGETKREPDDAGDDGIAPDERARILREFQEKHYRGWLDEKIPALSGKTPRQAARDPRLRKDLDLLLREIERAEGRRPAAERFDLGIVRRELGLGAANVAAPPQPGTPWPRPFPEPQGAASFEGAYLIHAGVVRAGRDERHVVVAARPGGKKLATAPRDGGSPAEAIAALVRDLPKGMKLSCEPSLESAMGRRGIVPGPLPRELAPMKAALALSLAIGSPEDLPPDALEIFAQRAAKLYRAEPWRHWGPREALRATVRAGSRTTNHEITVLGGEGAEPGFAIHDPGIGKQTDIASCGGPIARPGLSLLFGEDPAFLSAAFRTAFGIPLGPIPLQLTSREPKAADIVGVALLCAAADAIARLTPSVRTARGEYVIDGGARVTVDVSAPVGA